MSEYAKSKLLEAIEASKDAERITPESRAESFMQAMARVAAGETILVVRNADSDRGVVHDYYGGRRHLGFLECSDGLWDAYKVFEDPEVSPACLNAEPTSYVQAFTRLEEAIYG